MFCKLHKIFHEFQLLLNIFVVLAKPDKLWLYKFENVAILCMYMVNFAHIVIKESKTICYTLLG